MARRLTAILLVLALAAGCGSDDVDAGGDGGASGPSTTVEAQSVAATDDEADEGWLFVVRAEGGTSDGSTLSLTGVDDDLVAFGDRPARRAERLPTAALVDDWSTLGFDDDPPNAAVTVSTDEGEQTSVVVLRDPTFDTSSGTLTFTTEPVADDEGAGASFGHGGAPVDALPASFGPATVFVDTGDPAGQTADGKIAVFGVTEDDYDVLKESAEKAGRNACVTTEGLEICQLLEWTGSEVSWTVAAALLEGDDDAESAFELKVIYPGSVYAEAISPVENTDSKWVTVDWESPSVEVPGAGLELEAVVQIGDSAAVVVSCVVPHPGIPLSYYCIPGTE